jgi:hypothetical protein
LRLEVPKNELPTTLMAKLRLAWRQDQGSAGTLPLIESYSGKRGCGKGRGVEGAAEIPAHSGRPRKTVKESALPGMRQRLERIREASGWRGHEGHHHRRLLSINAATGRSAGLE